MKLNKLTVKIDIQVTHKDSVPALLERMANLWAKEVNSGGLRMEDGDEIFWDVAITPHEL